MADQSVTVRPAGIEDLEVLVQSNLSLAAETEAVQLDLTTVTVGIRALLEGRAPGRY